MTSSDPHKTTGARIRAVTTAVVLLLASGGWLWGLFSSEPLVAERSGAPSHRSEQQRLESFDEGQLRQAAEAYWNRYPDIRKHHYFGEHGPLGLDGARQHYLQHGRFEGRIYGEPSSGEEMSPAREQP